MADPQPDTAANTPPLPFPLLEQPSPSLSSNPAPAPAPAPTAAAADNDRRAQKIAWLEARIASLRAEIVGSRSRLEAVSRDLRSPAAAQTVKTHIALLHAYNEIRDVGQGLLALVAENRNVRVADLYRSGEFGVQSGD